MERLYQIAAAALAIVAAIGWALKLDRDHFVREVRKDIQDLGAEVKSHVADLWGGVNRNRNGIAQCREDAAACRGSVQTKLDVLCQDVKKIKDKVYDGDN